MLRADFLGALGGTAIAQVQSFAVTATLAVVCPLSGPAGAIGEQLADGVRGAIDAANRLRGPLDKVYTLRTFDDQNAVAQAMVNAQFAVGDGTVLAVIGHVSSRATLAAIPTYGQAYMPLIVPTSTDDQVTATNYRNVLRLPTKDSTEGSLFATYVAEQVHAKNAFVFVQDADYGADVANGFIAAMQSRKLAAPYAQFSYDKPDFSKVVAGALNAKFDYAFLAGTVADMGPIVGALRAQGYAGPIGASQGFYDAGSLKLGPAADGLVVSTSMPYLPLAPTALRPKTEYEARYGPMGPVSLFSYAAAQIAISTVQRTGVQARNALLTALMTGTPYSTIAGDFTFGPTGDPIDPELYFYTLRGGNFTYLRKAHASAYMLK